ncbi:unnamed protein product [Urochloa humidicola]
MAALAFAAITSPVAVDDNDSLKIRPSIESLIVYSFWVAGVVIYSVFPLRKQVLGACRMVLRFISSKWPPVPSPLAAMCSSFTATWRSSNRVVVRKLMGSLQAMSHNDGRKERGRKRNPSRVSLLLKRTIGRKVLCGLRVANHVASLLCDASRAGRWAY